MDEPSDFLDVVSHETLLVAEAAENTLYSALFFLKDAELSYGVPDLLSVGRHFRRNIDHYRVCSWENDKGAAMRTQYLSTSYTCGSMLADMFVKCGVENKDHLADAFTAATDAITKFKARIEYDVLKHHLATLYSDGIVDAELVSQALSHMDTILRKVESKD